MSACPREYDVIRQMHDGNRGACNAGILVVQQRASGKLYVEKKFIPEHVGANLAHREIDVHRRMDHKCIVKLVDYYISPSCTTASMFLEYCNAGSIGFLITEHAQSGTYIAESMVRNVFLQIAKALEYCHYGPEDSRRHWTPVLHKDVKPDNIFLKKIQGQYELQVKLGDFGCAEHMGERNPAGTPEFCPPEFPNSVEESDIWQLTATILCMCTLQDVPNLSLVPGPQYGQRLKNIIIWCGSYQVRERPRSTELRETLTREVEIVRDRLSQRLDPMLLYDWRYL